MNKVINITNRKNLEIYMDVQRQHILKVLETGSTPMTPSQISEKVNISPSSVTYHIKKLESLGLVELDHQEMVRGIQANFYRKVPCIINLCGDYHDDLKKEKMVLADYAMQETWNGFKNYIEHQEKRETETSEITGDFISGVFYLNDSEVRELKKILQQFHESHINSTSTTRPWEIAIVAYPTPSSMDFLEE